MTSEQRVKMIVDGGCPDRPATFDCIMNDSIIRHFAGEDPDMEDPRPVVHKAISQALDSTRIIIVYPQRENEEKRPDGALVKKRRWTTWYEKPIVSVVEAAEFVRNSIEQIGTSSIDMHGQIEAYEQIRTDLDDVFLFANFMAKTGIMLYSQIGLEYFSYLAADSPELLHQYYAAATNRSIRAIDAADFPRDINAVFDCEDIAYRGGTILSPDYLRKEFLPQLERLVDAWHRKGIKFIYHSDGNILDVLPDLVACGIDGLNPIETQAGLAISAIRKIAPELILIGGIDCSQILPLGSPEEVRIEAQRVLREAGPHSIVGSSSEVHSIVPLENYLAMLNTIKEWRW